MKYSAFLMALAALPLAAQPMTQLERDLALSSLHASRKVFLDSIAGLSAAQWKFKPGPDRWSISEIAEHVALTEEFLTGYAQRLLKTPAVKDRKVEFAADTAILTSVQDRTHKATHPPETAPTGRWATPEAAAAAFKERRDHTLAYVRTTQDDLRAHVGGTGPEAMDAYQMLLMIAGHADRHLAQINEVKASPQYPKN